jgi:hypothetical protein
MLLVMQSDPDRKSHLAPGPAPEDFAQLEANGDSRRGFGLVTEIVIQGGEDRVACLARYSSSASSSYSG